MKEKKHVLLKIVFSIIFLLIFINTVFADNYFNIIYPQKTDSLIIYEYNKIKYIDLSIILNVLNFEVDYSKTDETLRIESNKNYIILSINSPFYKQGIYYYKMKYTPIIKDNIILFPIKSLYIFKALLPKNTLLNDNYIKIIDKSTLINIKEYKNYIDINFNILPQYTKEITLRDVIFFIKDCDINKKIKKHSDKDILRVVEIIPDNKESTLILTFAPNMQVDFIENIKNTIRIHLKQRKSIPSNKNSININTIIIDAGHGGKDPGAIGYSGLQEKTVTLDIAIRLKKLIMKNMPDIKIVMTRTEDKFVSLKERTMLANKYPDAIFISIHCNASLNKQAKGAEVYFLSTAKTDWARAVEARENASLAFDIPEKEKKGLEFILWDMAQNEFLYESSTLAELVQREFEKTCKFPRGLNQAGFFVLKGNYMPAILVESAFISNKEEEKLLKTSQYRQKIAKNIFNGLKQFIKYYNEKNK